MRAGPGSGVFAEGQPAGRPRCCRSKRGGKFEIGVTADEETSLSGVGLLFLLDAEIIVACVFDNPLLV